MTLGGGGAMASAPGVELGLVSWTERRVRAGWRWLRTSNAYRFAHGTGHSAAESAETHLPVILRGEAVRIC